MESCNPQEFVGLNVLHGEESVTAPNFIAFKDVHVEEILSSQSNASHKYLYANGSLKPE